MKVLIITEKQDLSTKISTIAKNYGADTIIYKWFLKALDNLEEIQPDVIVLSAMEYPRHWKTLAGFVQSGIGGNDVKVYLYETSPLSEDDEKKAEDLGVISFVERFQKDYDSDVVNKAAEKSVVIETIEKQSDISDALDEEDDEIIDERLYTNVEIAYNEPLGIIHFGTGRYYEDEKIIELESELTNGSLLKYISLFDGNNVISFSGTVENIVDGLASIKVCEL